MENDEYFLTVMRYIHQNPLKAGIVKSIHEYKWSSYREYIGEVEIADVGFALNIFSQDNGKAKDLFRDFNMQKNNDLCLEYDEIPKISDSSLREYIKKLNIMESKDLQSLEKNKRNEILKELKQIRGVSARQLARVTGISKSVVYRV